MRGPWTPVHWIVVAIVVIILIWFVFAILFPAMGITIGGNAALGAMGGLRA